MMYFQTRRNFFFLNLETGEEAPQRVEDENRKKSNCDRLGLEMINKLYVYVFSFRQLVVATTIQRPSNFEPKADVWCLY